MIKNKALYNESQNKNSFNSSLSQWNTLCKNAYDEICATCENGSLKDLIMLRVEVVGSMTNNKRGLQLIDKAIKERFA